MRKLNRWVGMVAGGIALAAGIIAVMFVEFSPIPPPPRAVIRPVKSAIVQDANTATPRRFRGIIVPGKTVDLAFQVAGQIVDADLVLGRQVKRDALLATLDVTPMDQQIAVLKPTVEETERKLTLIQKAFESGVATANELSMAQAAYDRAAAELTIALQAKDDTTLRAPFDALIVQRFFEIFENVQAGQPVVRLQDISSVDIRVELPESIVARYRGDRPGKAAARFASLPGTSFDVTVKEASAEADKTTGGYPVTFTMPRPEEATILPGMGATIVLTPPEGPSGGVAVPAQAVFVDEAQGRCVWRLTEKDQHFIAAKIPINVTALTDDVAIVSTGLQPGWRVATAGVHFLHEGQIVRLMEQTR